MPAGQIRWTGLALAALSLAACHRTTPHLIERIEIASGDGWEDGVAVGLNPQEALAVLRDQLSRDKRFRLLPPTETPPADSNPVRLSLGLAFAQGDEAAGLEVRLIARCEQGGEPVRLDAVSDIKVPQETPPRAPALKQGLEHALLDAEDQSAAQLTALQASDAQLEKQLADANVNRREAALRVLTLRRNPAAVPIWIKRLDGDDPLSVRQAIGALIELKDPSATPALIELARRKDTGFLREIIFALEAIGGDEAEGYLYTVAQGHDEPRVREAAQAAWKSLEERHVHKESK